MIVRALVPRLADNGERDRLWDYCRSYWAEQMPEMEIVEGHHEGGGPFNRSASINKAAKGDWDVAVILDSDSVVDPGQVRDAIELAVKSGELVLPFDSRNMLNPKGTQQILGGFVGSWSRWVGSRERNRVSCCVVVPRALWDAVGGFDERFEGWGAEDEAFHAACTALGGSQRLRGPLWHFHHAPSPHHNQSTALYRQALRLGQRYSEAGSADGMRHLLREPRDPDQVLLLVLTTGKRETLTKALASAEEKLSGPVGRRLICVDGYAGTAHEVQKAHPGWDVEPLRAGKYPKAVSAAIEKAIGSGQRFILFLEDDFTFNEPVDLCEMQAIVERNDLAQLSLKRQAWYPHELEAGGVIEANPDAFTQRDGYVEHSAYWTMNPMLTRRSTLAEHKWPQGRDSELRFGRSVFADPRVRAGILGSIEDAPRVEHIGMERAGSGY